MNRLILILTILFSFASATSLVAQEDKKSKPSKTASALLSVFDGETEVIADNRSLDDIASAVSAVLSGVDRDHLNGLQKQLDSLESEEADLRRMLTELDQGLPVPISVTGELDATSVPTTPETVESEKEHLLGLKAELARKTRRQAEQRSLAEQLEAAKKPTRSTRALLTALGDLPEAKDESETVDVLPVASTPFPRKLADALYRTADYRGALRLYQKAQADNAKAFGSKDRYRLARCHEWLGESDKALKVLEELIAAQPDASDFWHQRAQSYLTYLQKAPKLERVLKQS